MMYPNAQIFLYYLTAATTHLAGVAWIDLHRSPTSVFSFVRGQGCKLTPCRVCDGLSETMIFEHPSEVQLFKDDDTKSIDQLSTLLMGKFSAFVSDSLIQMGYYFAAFATFWTAFLFCTQFALYFGESLLLFSKELMISVSLTI
jgi:hypothetical protein